MKESYREGVANHPGPEPCGGGRNAALEALDRGICRLGIETPKSCVAGSRRRQAARKATMRARDSASVAQPRGVEDPKHAEKLHAREPGGPVVARGRKAAGRRENAMSGKSLVHGSGESYGGVVPTKQPNKSEPSPAEAAEGRPPTKENTPRPNPCRTPSRESGPSGLERVREAAVRFDVKHPNIRGKNRVR